MAQSSETMSVPRLIKTAASKTIAVFGAAYGGYAAARHLAESLPQGWRIVVVDRNTHFNHVYVYPRYSVLPGYSHQGFIPYTNIFGSDSGPSRNVILNARVTKLNSHSAVLSKAFPEHGIDGDEPTLHFDYAIYALGSHMPAPINIWGPTIDEENAPLAISGHATSPNTPGVETVQPWSGPALSEVTTATSAASSEASASSDYGTKSGGIEWLGRSQKYIEKLPSVLVVGGGALGIQYATDIADIYPDKVVTLLHSRTRLLPRFDEAMHTEIIGALSSLNVNTILGDRLDLSQPAKSERNKDGILEHIVHTVSGREIRASLILLCTGQTPNTDLMRSLIPESIVPEGPSKNMIRVKRTMQVGVPSINSPETLAARLSNLSVNDSKDDEMKDPDLDAPHPHLFAVGDAADAFGAINAGHTAHAQAHVAGNNILSLIKAGDDTAGVKLEEYRPGLPGIKMTIGRNKLLWQIQGEIGGKECPDGLLAPIMWKFLLEREVTEEEMYE